VRFALRRCCHGFVVLCSLLCASVFLAQTPFPRNSSEPTGGLPKPNYVLATNDLISIKVFQEDDLQTQVRVAKDGTITFPLIGVVRVGGKTPQEAARTIRDMLAKGYLVNPQVTVNVLEYFKYRLTVLGQVQKPGSYDFPDRDRLTLLEAIGLAGGYTRAADPSKVLIKRLVNGKEKVYRLNAKNMASQQSTTEFEVLPGDVITVAESIF
jgi:protein involved in polysaccharide export with SLBB domain